MTNKQHFLATLQDELPRSERVLKALPQKQANYRPHAHSRSALELASTVFGNEVDMWIPILKAGELDFMKFKPKKFTSFVAVLKDFRAGMKKTIAQISKMSDQQWDSKAVMRMGEKEEWASTRGAMTWGMLLDMIHHRGQLSVYIRPMGGKVPSIYGPSGDSK